MSSENVEKGERSCGMKSEAWVEETGIGKYVVDQTPCVTGVAGEREELNIQC